MLESGLTNIAMFFVVAGVCLIFVIAWIIKSESRINVCKSEIARLKNQLESSEREKFMISEKVDDIQASPAAPTAVKPSDAVSKEDANGALLLQALEQNADLEKENKRLKSELAEAKSSLEEVYKALSAQG